MKVSANKLVYDFNRKFSATKSGESKTFHTIEIVSYLNEALITWYHNRIKIRELNDRVRNSLKVYEVKNKTLKVEKEDLHTFKVKYPDNYYATNNIVVECTKKDCCDGIYKEIQPTVVQSDDLPRARKDVYQKSSFEWERLLADEAGQYLYFYHDGECDAKKVKISYMRQPDLIQAPELCENVYEDYDGKLITQKVDLEVDNDFDANTIVDIAILCASRDTMDSQGFQTQINKILNLRNL